MPIAEATRKEYEVGHKLCFHTGYFLVALYRRIIASLWTDTTGKCDFLRDAGPDTSWNKHQFADNADQSNE